MSKSKEPSLRYQQFTEEWEPRKMRDISNTITKGTTPRDKTWTGDINYVKTESIDKNFGNISVTAKTSKEEHEGYLKRSQLEEGDVLFSIVGTLGRVGIVKTKDLPANTNQQIAIIRLNDVVKQFVFQALKTSRVASFIKSDATIGAQPSLSLWQIDSFKIYLPSLEEQTRLATFFKSLDNTIALHQRKSNKLKQIKKSLMIQMFPKNGVDTPELRIGEYSDNWKEEQLGQLVEQVKSYSLSRDVETKNNTGFRYIHYGDIHTKVADMIDSKSKLPNIKEGQYELLKKGDVVVADASEDYQGIATPAVITTELPYKLVAGLHTIALRPKKIDSVFLYYLIHSPAFREYGYRIGTGMKVFGISAKNLLNFEGKLPSIEEQTAIGNFFKHLDETIAIHQEKYEKLKQIKTALLNDMFV